nr:hypothetical protein [Liquorilactobacillus uvarum]
MSCIFCVLAGRYSCRYSCLDNDSLIKGEIKLRLIDSGTTWIFLIAMLVFMVSAVFLIVFSTKNRHYKKTITMFVSSFAVTFFCILSRTHLLRATLLSLFILLLAVILQRATKHYHILKNWKIAKSLIVLGAVLLSLNVTEILYVRSYKNQVPIAKANKNDNHLEYLRTNHRQKTHFEGPYKSVHHASKVQDD